MALAFKINREEQCIGRFDEYDDGTVIVEVYRYWYQGRPFVKAVRTVMSTGKEKTILNIPQFAAIDLAKTILKGSCTEVKSALLLIE